MHPGLDVLGLRARHRARQLLHAVVLPFWVLAGAGAAAESTGWPTGIVDRVRFLPAAGREAAMVGGKFSGSNESPFEGFQALGEIVVTPAAKGWTELKFPNRRLYRWVRYEAPPGSRGNIAELEFYSGERKLTGAGFGSPGFLAPGRHWKAAFDKNPDSFFNSNNLDEQFVGFDLGDTAATARPVISPGDGEYAGSELVALKSRTPGAIIRFTLDGTLPTTTNGQTYASPLRVGKTTIITAVALLEGLAPSAPAVATLRIGQPERRGLHSFHVGNSLTNNASRLPIFLRTAGADNDFPKFLIGGATTAQLWQGRLNTEAKRFDDVYAAARHPLDYFTLQPRDFDLARETENCVNFIRLVRKRSPEVQTWLYAEWNEFDRQRPIDTGHYLSPRMKRTFPALTWEESMSAMVLYNEDVQSAIEARQVGGKAVRILPTAVALGWARHLVDQGLMPGVSPGETAFYRFLFEDHVHANANGCYLVALTWFAALYRETPERVVLPSGTTLSPQQATTLQRLAWDVVKNFPNCGIFEIGAEHCARPSITSDGRKITLGSATPGAWFRYTLDGSLPSRTHGYVYCGVISVQPGIHVRAVAYKSGMADSDVTELPALGP